MTSRRGDDGAQSSNVEIFLRLKPVKNPTDRILVDANESKVEFSIPRDVASGYVNNQREHYEFVFNGILTQEAKQDEVFERVARPVVSGALEGFNGTIFAYGQTGSGKTFTMTGGAERYVDRGIIPRTISAIFAEVSNRSDHQFTVHISYLEIYNETGYDLLDKDREVKALEDLTRVHVKDDEDDISFRNLSNHLANNEEDALNLLFLGDTNRVIGTTLMNDASSRSHCLFIINITARKRGEDTVRRSKLNLVDLAGSERVSKTGADGKTLMQAKYINLSLLYLEQVVNALRERSEGISRPHIPYRNSMMTIALKDSLGGNCRTTMIATISSDTYQMDESISTCRFAERICAVRNQVLLNEEVDPALVIRRLKQEIRDLNEEIRMLKGGEEQRSTLTPDEIARLQKQIEAYCSDNDPAAALNLGGSMLFIRAAFDVFRNLVKNGGGGGKGAGGGGFQNGGSMRASTGSAKGIGGGGGDMDGLPADAVDQIKTLKKQVQQRDTEINILVSMLQRRDGGGAAGPGPGAGRPGPTLPIAPPSGSPAMPPPPRAFLPESGPAMDASSLGPPVSADDVAALMNIGLLGGRNKAFELFRKSYRQNEVIEENKALLKEKYDAAKGLGQAVNDSKERINELKSLIEQRRVQRAMSGEDQEEDPEEDRCKDLIEQEKRRYKEAFAMLRDHKKEIEHLQLLFEQSRTRLRRDFEQWMALMTRQAQMQQQQAQQGQQGQQGQGLPMQGLLAGQGMGGLPSSSPMASASSSYAMGSPGGMAAMSSGRPPMMMGAAPPAAPRQAWGDSGSGSPMGMAPGGQMGLMRSSSASRHANSPTPGGGGGGSVSSSQQSLPRAAHQVDPQVLELARPYLTGNADADEDIIKFYEAKHKLMQQMKRAG